jgi:hypothetical protein
MEKKLTVEEVYQCLALLQGISIKNTETGEVTTSIIGFANEKGISEGMRRIANKTAKKLKENYPEDQFKTINALDVKDLFEGAVLPEGYEEKDTDKEEIKRQKDSKMKELVESVVTFDFEELPDFLMLDKRLEDRKETLSYNYTYLFEKLFLNY